MNVYLKIWEACLPFWVKSLLMYLQYLLRIREKLYPHTHTYTHKLLDSPNVSMRGRPLSFIYFN